METWTGSTSCAKATSSRTTAIRATIVRSAAAVSGQSGAATAALTRTGSTSSTTSNPQGPRHPHASIGTKSIAATVIGIALGRGEIRSLDQPFLEHFGDKDLSRIDPRLRTATIADVLTMRSGIEWHEQDRPLGDTNTTIQLERSRDWIQFTLDQPMDAEFTFSTSND